MTRRAALTVVAALIQDRGLRARGQVTATCAPVPEELRLELGAGACSVQRITVVWGTRTATVTTAELMEALGAHG